MVLKPKSCNIMTGGVWEWCKNVWYSNLYNFDAVLWQVWEWCKNVWYSNTRWRKLKNVIVWEWCKNVWYSNIWITLHNIRLFENDVKMYGTQTSSVHCINISLFENDVKMYGTQTGQIYINGINILLINFWWMNVVLVEMKKHIKGHY